MADDLKDDVITDADPGDETEGAPAPEPVTEPEVSEEEELSLRDQVAAAAAKIAKRKPEGEEKAEAKPEAEEPPAEEPEPEAEEPAAAEPTPEQRAEQEAITAARTFHSEVTAALEPHSAVLAQMGLSPATAIKNLIQIYTESAADPVKFVAGLGSRYAPTMRGTPQARQTVAAFARSLGVDLGATPVQAQPQPGHDEAIAQGIAQAQPRSDMTPERIAEIVEQSMQSHAIQAATAQAQVAINEFTTAKDDAGNPKHPHVETVRGTMAALMQAGERAGKSLTLEEAYNQAIWTRPELRETLTKAQSEQAARDAAAARKEGIAKARAAQSPKTASRPIPPEDPGDMPLKELVARNARELGIGAG